MKNFHSIKFAIFLSATLVSSPIFADTTVNVIGGPNAPVPDATITTKVQEQIAKDTTLTGTNITVSTQNGVVKLSGGVNTQNQADAALSDAKAVSGIKDVKSTITVQSSEVAPVVGH